MFNTRRIWFGKKMVDVPTDESLYAKFEDSIAGWKGDSWTLAVFEGSPEGDKYSWCDDCVAASGDLRNFLSEHRGKTKVLQFKVGRKDEWEGRDGGPSPFKAKLPHLSDLPTVVLFRGGLEVARMIQPRKDDYTYLSRRVEKYEQQILDGSWKPPAQHQ